MSIASITSLVDVLREHDLLGAPQLETVTRDLRVLFRQPWAMAEELVRREWLTAFQVDLLFRDGPQRLVLGPYVLLEQLGEGGMGQVFRARHKALDRVVALKVIRKDRLAHPEALRRFRREVRAAAQLNHPNIVQAYDAGDVDGTHFFAMEYVEGVDIGRRLRQVGHLPVGEACEYTRQAALGLQHAFERGLVHRDVKPANLMVSTPGGNQPPVVKILDMGLALVNQGIEEEPTSALTEQGLMMGTLDYLAPEQAQESHSVDIRADLYSLGCTLYHMLAGCVPFPAGSMMERLLKHRMDEPRPVAELRPDTPPEVVAVLARLLAKRPEDRYETPADLAEALAPMARAFVPPAPKERTVLVRRVRIPAVSAAAAAAALRTEAPALRTEPEVACPATVVMASEPQPSTRPQALIPRPVPPLPPRREPPAPAPPVTPPVAKRSRRWAVVVALLFGIALAVGVMRLARPGPALRAREEAPGIPETWRGLEARAADPAEDGERLRADLLAFRARHPGTDEGLAAARLLARQPSPLDALAAAERPGHPAWPRETLRLQAVSPLHAVAFRPDGRLLATGGEDGYVYLWDLPSGEKRRAAGKHAQAVRAVAYSPDGMILASGSTDGIVQLWDGRTGEEVTTLRGHTGAIRVLAFAPDGNTLASGGSDGSVRLWDVATAHCAATLVVGSPVASVAFTPDGQTVAAGGLTHAVRQWDVRSRKSLSQQPDALSGPVVAFTPDGKSLVAGGDGGVLRLWDRDGPTLTGGVTLPASKAAMQAALTPDGSMLAALDRAGDILLWGIASRQATGRHALPKPVHALTLASDSRHVAVACGDGSVRILRLAPCPAR